MPVRLCRWPCSALGLLTASTCFDLGPDRIHTPHVVLWLFALGWAARAGRHALAAARCVTARRCSATVPGFFADPRREAVIVAGVALLVWAAGPARARAAQPRRRRAGGRSLYIYLTHWQVYPHLEEVSALGATLASVAVGLAYRQLELRVRALLPRRRLQPVS